MSVSGANLERVRDAHRKRCNCSLDAEPEHPQGCPLFDAISKLVEESHPVNRVTAAIRFFMDALEPCEEPWERKLWNALGAALVPMEEDFAGPECEACHSAGRPPTRATQLAGGEPLCDRCADDGREEWEKGLAGG